MSMILSDTDRQLITVQPALIAAWLFGSQANGSIHAASDLDLALLFQHGQIPPLDALLALRFSLEASLSLDVDLVVLNDASPILAFQVIRKGQLITCHDTTAYHRYVMRVVSEYADFKQIRKPIEAALRKQFLDG